MAIVRLHVAPVDMFRTLSSAGGAAYYTLPDRELAQPARSVDVPSQQQAMLQLTGAAISAASTKSARPEAKWIWRALLFVVVGYAFGSTALWLGGTDKRFVVSADWSAFGALFILALAVERALEPVSEWMGPSTSDAAMKRDQAQAKAEHAMLELADAAHDLARAPDDKNMRDQKAGKQSTAETSAKEAATERSNLDSARTSTAIVLWGAATGLAAVLCGLLHVTLLTAIADQAHRLPNAYFDLAVTGLIVGAGTKPLHDLVSSLQKSKDAQADAKTETA